MVGRGSGRSDSKEEEEEDDDDRLDVVGLDRSPGKRLPGGPDTDLMRLIITGERDGQPDSVSEATQELEPDPIKTEQHLSDTSQSDQLKPIRPFDVSSLIKKEERESPESPLPTPPPPPVYPPYLGLYQHLLPPSLSSPLMLQAQLALAAQHNSFLASAYASLSSSARPSLERMKSSRFSPYTSNTTSSTSSPSSTTSNSSSSRSAFQAVGRRSPPSSPARIKTISPPLLSPSSPGGIKNIQQMVNGLNGGAEGKFGLTHSGETRRGLTH